MSSQPQIPQFDWIWDGDDPGGYNAWRWFRRRFDWDENGLVQLAITADSRYRLWVNGDFVEDGPVRAWPEHYRADLLDITPLLQAGSNELRVLVQFYGCGTFQGIAQRAGLAAVLFQDERELTRTDASWDTASAPEYLRQAPRVSVQLPLVEIFDARLAEQQQQQQIWRPATLLGGSLPWTVVRWRDVARPFRQPIEITALAGARWLPARAPVYCVPLLHLLYPGAVQESVGMSRACALAATVTVVADADLPWGIAEDWEIYIDGENLAADGIWRAKRGVHRIVAAYSRIFYDRVDAAFDFPRGENLLWSHPLGETDPATARWMFVRPEALRAQGGDQYWPDHPSAFALELIEQYRVLKERWQAASADPAAFSFWLRAEGRSMPQMELFYPDPDGDFRARQPGDQAPVLRTTEGWLLPARAGSDLELQFDLGDQICGEYKLEIEAAAAGTVIDVALVEYIRPDGVLQPTTALRNGFRYIARAGRQVYRTRQRPSGRHLFVTVRQCAEPVKLRRLTVSASGYPAACPASFRCSDAELTRSWAASDRTMQLSMDDVFIDSLWEQTLWVGDARVEQLYALRTYDARDISLRSMRLAAESVSRAPMVLSQVPSSWENILPVWSFLWGLSVWEYYDYTGDEAALREMWPAVKKNLRGGAYQLNEHDLFEAPWWNLFEWARVDMSHRTVLYVTIFFLAAVQAAQQCAEVLGDRDEAGWLEAIEKRLRRGIESMWNPNKGLYHESVHRDGTRSGQYSMHPQFLAALYGAAGTARATQLLDAIAEPKEGLERIASPFALHFYCEALERFGREEAILEQIRQTYLPMLAAGTTVWEVVPGSCTTPPGFPTRSHCHGWSAGPLDFLPRILLGIRAAGPGSRKFILSPQPHGLSWAEGCLATPFGPIKVRWDLHDGLLRLSAGHPPQCEVVFEPNARLALVASRFEVTFH